MGEGPGSSPDPNAFSLEKKSKFTKPGIKWSQIPNKITPTGHFV